MPDDENTMVTKTSTPADKQRVGLAFQGGSFLGGSIAAGTVRGLVEGGACEAYDLSVFSGISSGALVATVCWGHALAGTVDQAPDTLRDQWLYNAYDLIQNEAAGNAALLADELLSGNPIYSLGVPRLLGYPGFKSQFLVPMLRGLFGVWVRNYVKPEQCMRRLYDLHVRSAWEQADTPLARRQALDKAFDAYRNDPTRPRLVIGAADILRGENAEFTDTTFFSFLYDELGHSGDLEPSMKRAADRLVECVMASGSLDDLNGITQIISPAYAWKNISGYYLDGGWSENPPVSTLTDCGVDQIWLVEVFPKERAKLPETYEERADRREELWQNSGVEQQLAFINKLNLWIESGRLVNDATELATLRTQLSNRIKNGPRRDDLIQAWRAASSENADCNYDDLLDNVTQPYRPITVRRISLPEDLQELTHGARIVNARSFITDMIERGRQNALRFRSTLMPKGHVRAGGGAVASPSASAGS